MTLDAFRRIALGFPEATESAHMAHPDFRVRKKIFATLWPKEKWAVVMLTPQQQNRFIQAESDVFFPVKGGWGLRGATHVKLKAAKKALVHSALTAAWLNAAPKTLAEQFEGE